jgi:hypothetical protein
VIKEKFNNEISISVNDENDFILFEFENISSKPIILSWEHTFIKDKSGNPIYKFPYQTDVVLPGEKISRNAKNLNVLLANSLSFQYRVGLTVKNEDLSLMSTNNAVDFSTVQQKTSEVAIEPISSEPIVTNWYDYEWNRISSITIPNGWVEKDNYGRILSVGGFNSGIGISIKQYFSPVKINSWNGFWEYGLVTMIVPYIEIGSDYVWVSGWYVGFSLNIPMILGINVGRYF